MKVYVLCPAQYVTGGPEALHQLAAAGRMLGFDTSLVYFPEKHPAPTSAVFECYDVRVAAAVCDASDSVVIVPETETPRLLPFHLATRVVWWLSVDNFEIRAEALRQGRVESPLNFVFNPAFGLVHLAQSEYARRHLAQRGQMSHLLTDYIRTEIVERARALRSRPKRDIVAFNPKKGLEFTRALIAESPPSLQWIPIENMSPAEVADLLCTAKVYVDFGSHPGRDRIPREAALCGACVVTGTQGSAGNPVDLPIPDCYKFDERVPTARARILQCLSAVVADYGAHRSAFEPYRCWIEGQQSTFADETFAALALLRARLRDRQRMAA